MNDPRPKSAAVFLDRDGTLMEDVDYCNDPGKVRIIPGVPEALRRLRKHGFMTVIITNQSGIGRGSITREQYRLVHEALIDKLGGNLIDAAYVCPHDPKAGCACRKPHPFMVQQAAADHGIDLASSYFIGDKESDILCGRNAGTHTILVLSGYGRQADDRGADYVAQDMNAAADVILENMP